MDFANRNTPHRAPAAVSTQAAHPAAVAHDGTKGGRLGRFRGNNWLTIGALILLFGGVILIIAMLLGLNLGGANADEAKFVNKDQMQAVFVNVNGTTGGQVYFGKIKDLNKDYIQLTDVYYIQNQTNTGQNNSQAYNLVKLGCELHGPEDQMLINRSEVFFWENIKNDGQVAQKAAEFKKQNPNGQNCSQSQQQNSAGQATGGNANAANTQTAAPATTTTKP